MRPCSWGLGIVLVLCAGCSSGGSSGGHAGTSAGGASGGSSGAGGGSGSGPCASAYETPCDGVCVNLATDRDNCGACGVKCGAGECANATCHCAVQKELCGGTCIDVSDDPENCGACGRSCLGGACLERACVPELLFTSPEPILFLESDGTTLFWVSETSLFSAPLAGGTPALLASLSADPVALALGASHVYVALELTDVVQIPKTGGAVTTFAAATQPRAIDVFGGKVYWSGQFAGGAGIGVADESGGPATLIAPEQYPPSYVRAASNAVVYTRYEDLRRVDPNGDNPTLLAPLEAGGGVVGLELAAGRVWVAREETSVGIDPFPPVILHLPLAGGAVEEIDSKDVQTIASDQVRVCWSTRATWTYCLEHGSSTVRTIAKMQGGQDIALAESHAILVNRAGTLPGTLISLVPY